MNDYMINKADEQIEHGLSERDNLLREIEKLKEENKILKDCVLSYADLNADYRPLMERAREALNKIGEK